MKKKSLHVLFLTLCTTIQLFAAAPDVTLSEVAVTAQKREQTTDAQRTILTITEKEIATLPVQTIQELLEYLPGIDIRTRGGNGVQADISMRGGSFDQVVILLNGINITDAQTGHHNLNMPIDISQIARIELLQGNNTHLFGTSAFCGAINIVTKHEATKNTISAHLLGGENGLFNPSVSGQFLKKNWQIGASLSHNQSTGYIENSDYKIDNLFLETQHKSEKAGVFHLQLGGQLKEFGSNGFYSLRYPSQFEATKMLFGSFSWKKQFGLFQTEATTYYRYHYDRYELFRNSIGAANWYTGHNYHATNTVGANIKGSYLSRIGKSTVGIEIRNEQIRSNVLGHELTHPITAPFTKDSVQFTHGNNRLNLNYFAAQNFYFGNWNGSVGISGNYNNSFGFNHTYGGHVGYQFSSNNLIRLNVNSAIRIPTFTDLFYKSAVFQSNPNLVPEESLMAELLMRYTKRGVKMQLSTYYRIGRNIIDWLRLPEESVWKSMNHTRIDAMGGEVSIGYQHNYWLKNIGANYSFTHLNKKEGNLISRYALDYVRHKLVLQLEHGIYKGFGANWSAGYQQREGEYTNVSSEVVGYAPFWLLDGRVYWKNEQLQLYVEATNILNTHYYDYGGIEQPRRWIKAGISLRM